MRCPRVPLLLAVVAGLMAGGCQRRTNAGVTAAGGASGQSQGGTAAAAASRELTLTLLYGGAVSPQSGPGGSHGGAAALARRATVVDRLRSRMTPLLQVVVGDLFAEATASDEEGPDAGTRSPSQSRSQSQSQSQSNDQLQTLLRAYARMGVDAVTLGERDLKAGPARLREALKRSKVDVVAANLAAARQGKAEAPLFPADTTIANGGEKVGIFGVIEVASEGATTVARLGFRSDEAAEAARAAAQGLRKRGAGLVVGLFHVAGGTRRVRDILAHAPGIDIAVIGRRSGPAVPDDLAPGAMTSVGATVLVAVPATGDAIGCLKVSGLGSGSGPRFENRLLAVPGDVPQHLGVALIHKAPDAAAAIDDASSSSLRNGSPRTGQRSRPTAMAKMAKTANLAAESWTYGSNGACELCHKEEAGQWRTTDHAQALATLTKGKHDREPECLGCHTTGYLLPGGTQRLDTALKYFANVGCESCHGPSAMHVRSMDKKKGTSRRVEPEVCLGCHTADWNIGPFEIDVAWKAVLGPGHGVPAAPSNGEPKAGG